MYQKENTGQNANESLAKTEQEKAEAHLSSLLEAVQNDENLGEAIDKVFEENVDVEKIQSQVILLINEYLNKRRAKRADKLKNTEEQDKYIEENIGSIAKNILNKLTKKGLDIDEISENDGNNILSTRAKKDLKKSIKNFAIYQVYKVINPKRIAGETKKDNYVNNLMHGGQKLASKYEGGKSADLKQYGRAEVARIKSMARASKGGFRGR
jgi:hypothetical protein